MNVLLIIYKGEISNINILQDRINSIGQTLYAFRDTIFLLTDLNTKEVYEKIADNGFEHISLMIINIQNIVSLGFWGRMPSSLWNWLDANRDITLPDISKTYAAELKKMNDQIQTLRIENEHLKSTVAENNKIIENLYAQTQSFQHMIKDQNENSAQIDQ